MLPHHAALRPPTPIAHSIHPKIFANHPRMPSPPIRHPAPNAPDAHRHPPSPDAPIRSPPHPTAHPPAPTHATPTCRPSNKRPTPALPDPPPHHSPRHSRPRQNDSATSARTQETATSPPPAMRSNSPTSPPQIHANHPPIPLLRAGTSTRRLPHRESRRFVECAGSSRVKSHHNATIGPCTLVSNASRETNRKRTRRHHQLMF